MPDPIKIVRVVATSDLHGNLPEIPPCEVLLLAGDITPATNHDVGFQARWLDGPFRAWLDRVPAARVVGVAGNHDFVFQQRPDLVPTGLRWTYLQDSGCDVCGLSVFGTPWQPFFGRWAFNAPEEDGERFLADRFAGILAGTEIVVCHGPPAGYGDVTSRGDATGSTALRHHLDRVRPRLAVFGHIHEGFGRWDVDGRTMANVSLVDEQYRPANRPVVFDLAVPALPRRVVVDRDAGDGPVGRVLGADVPADGGGDSIGGRAMPIEFMPRGSDMFAAPYDARVNAVNTVGVMGKGLAKAFADRYPDMLADYKTICRSGDFRPGGLWTWRGSSTVVYNCATKADWRRPSRIEWVRDSLGHLRRSLHDDRITSVAVPALGCGLGGLAWSRVRPMVVDALAGWPGRAVVYEG